MPPLSATVQDLNDGHRVGANHWPNPQTDGSAIGNFTCITNPPQTFELYAHVSIIVNGEAQAIPTDLGAAPTGNTHCFYTVHTHDSTGKVHVTPSASGTFTLSNFFEIWKQPFSNTNVAGFTGLPVAVFVTDGTTTTRVDESGWNDIELKSHREITISVGTEVTEIPNFTWSP